MDRGRALALFIPSVIPLSLSLALYGAALMHAHTGQLRDGGKLLQEQPHPLVPTRQRHLSSVESHTPVPPEAQPQENMFYALRILQMYVQKNLRRYQNIKYIEISLQKRQLEGADLSG